jgi:hypothetical protein
MRAILLFLATASTSAWAQEAPAPSEPVAPPATTPAAAEPPPPAPTTPAEPPPAAPTPPAEPPPAATTLAAPPVAEPPPTDCAPGLPECSKIDVSALPPLPLIEEPAPLKRFAVDAELGKFAYPDDAFARFSNGDAMPLRGFRVGYRFAEHGVAQLGWLHGGRGMTTDLPNQRSFVAAYLVEQLSAGVRVDANFDDVLLPYAAARGLVAVQRARLDDDLTVNDNPGQVQAGAVAPGGELLIGLEVRVPPDERVAVAFTIEAGYGAVLEAELGDLGGLRSGGAVIHSGLGLRF